MDEPLRQTCTGYLMLHKPAMNSQKRSANGFKAFFGLLIAVNLAAGTGFSQSDGAAVRHIMRITTELRSPVRLAATRTHVYVVDAFLNRVFQFDLNGRLQDSLPIGGRPLAVTADQNEVIYISNRVNGRLHMVDFQQRVSKPLPHHSIRFALPADAVFDRRRFFYVVDSKLAKIIRLDAAGRVVDEFGQGLLTFPTGIALDVKNQRILVAEHGGIPTKDGSEWMIHVFSLNGTRITRLVKSGAASGKLTRAQGLAVDSHGRIYVADPFQGRVNVYSEKGVFLAQIGVFGRAPGELRLPMDVAVDARDRIWVASMNNGAVEVYEITDLPTAVQEDKTVGVPKDFVLMANFPNPFQKGTYIPFVLSRRGNVTVRIYNDIGVLIRTFHLGEQPAGAYTGSGKAVFWDGNDSQGKAVASGIYFYELQFDQKKVRRKMLLVR